MKNENYITIQGWMINELKLTGNDLICYAIIYGFSQDGETEFSGSHSYLADTMGVTRACVGKVLKRLEESNLIRKNEVTICAVKFCRYSAITEFTSCKQSLQPPVNKVYNHCKQSLHNNIEDNNSNDTIVKEVYNKKKKTLFFENEKLKDLDYFLSKFNTPDYEQIDMVFYYHAVGDWSYSSGTKRDENGWLATTRNFIRSDMDKGHLRTKTGVMKSTQSIKKEKEYMDILNIEKELQAL